LKLENIEINRSVVKSPSDNRRYHPFQPSHHSTWSTWCLH